LISWFVLSVLRAMELGKRFNGLAEEHEAFEEELIPQNGKKK